MMPDLPWHISMMPIDGAYRCLSGCRVGITHRNASGEPQLAGGAHPTNEGRSGVCTHNRVLYSAKWLLWLLLIVLVLPAHAAHDISRDISPQRECATCHVMWLTDFKRKGVTTLIPYNPRPVVATGRQDIASTERMCFSCHDGFVLDSRFVFADRRHFHPVGVVPSPNVHIPTSQGKQVFPLNDDGKIYCGTCHSAHGVDWGEEYSPVFLRTKNVDSSLCFACHLERGTGTDEGNHPVFREIAKLPNLDGPPEKLRDLGSKFGEGGTVICQSCHRVHGARDRKLLMVPNNNSALCGNCHDDRYVGGYGEAQSKHTHPINVKPVRAKVPDTLIDLGSKLGEGGTVICQTCHKPHNAQAGPKILVKRNDDAQLCVQCHAEKASVIDSKHDMRLVEGAGLNKRGQTTHEGGVCSACHVPHRGNGPKMWARTLGDGPDPMAETCLSCHRDGGVAEKYQVGRFTHPVGRPLSTLPDAVSLPGFGRAGARSTHAKTGAVTCASCHNPHQWDPDDPARKAKPGDKGDAGNSFLRQANAQGSVLCLTCHKDKLAVKGSKHDMAIMAPDERNIKGQLPRIAGVCSACHVPHRGAGPVMLARQPGKGGGDAISSVCLSCHDPQGAAHKKLVGEHSHPVGRPIANIGIRATVNGWISRFQERLGLKPLRALPLFDEQGHKVAEDGLVTCASCHDPHKWAPHGQATAGGDPHKIEGDAASSFLRIANDASSTLCVNCHREQSAITLSKHNLDISAPQAHNANGESVSKAGPCSACHLPHQGQGAKMWARSGLDKHAGISGLCISCHSEGGLAEKRVVGAGGHPVHKSLTMSAVGVQLPLFTQDGARNGDMIECATCHNPHQWDPRDAASTAGARIEAEGDAETSFLRLPTIAQRSILCTECHK